MNDYNLKKKNKISFVKFIYILTLIVTFFFSYLVINNIFLPLPLWGDEIDSIKHANVLLENFPNNLLTDVHPPLYPLILNSFFSILGNNFVAARLPNLIFTFLSLIFIFEFLKFKSKYFKIIFLLLFCSSWAIIYYTSEVRHYSLLAFFSTCLFCNIYQRIYLKYKNLNWFFVISFFCLLTHYISIIFIFSILIIEFFYSKKKKYLVFFFIFAIFFILVFYFHISKFYSIGILLDAILNNKIDNLTKNFQYFTGVNFNLFHLIFGNYNKKYFYYILFIIFYFFSHFFFTKKIRNYINFPLYVCLLSIFLIFFLNVPRINDYIYIFLLPFSFFYTTALIFFSLRKFIKLRKFIIACFSFYIILSLISVYVKMDRKWNGSTTFVGTNNLYSIKNLCETENCIYVNNSHIKYFNDVEKNVKIFDSLNYIDNELILSLLNNNYQIIIDNPKYYDFTNISTAHNCFVLSRNLIRDLVIFTNRNIIPRYADYGTNFGLNTFDYHKNKQCF